MEEARGNVALHEAQENLLQEAQDEQRHPIRINASCNLAAHARCNPWHGYIRYIVFKSRRSWRGGTCHFSAYNERLQTSEFIITDPHFAWRTWRREQRACLGAQSSGYKHTPDELESLTA